MNAVTTLWWDKASSSNHTAAELLSSCHLKNLCPKERHTKVMEAPPKTVIMQ